jgi:hypothetical protein
MGMALSVRMIRPDNRLTDDHEIWYECYASGGYSKIVHLDFCNQCTNMADRRTFEVGVTQVTLNRRSYGDVWLQGFGTVYLVK